MEKYRAWVVAVDMGYGHQRAAYPLRRLSPTGRVLIANNYEGIPKHDFSIWNNGRKIYELFSRASNVPYIGKYIFRMLDKFQEIEFFYPKRDLSAPNTQVKQTYSMVRRGWGKHLVKKLNEQDIPLITTFFTVAFMAEEHGFRNDIYVQICDADVSRTWAPLNPQKSKIKYLAPCRRVVERLKLYGVKEESIYLTGFPLPEENLGGTDLKILKVDLAERLVNLDPLKRYRNKYSSTIKHFLPDFDAEASHSHPLTITFAVGGAGAQRSIGVSILKSLRKKLFAREVYLNLIAGTRADVNQFFNEAIKSLGLEHNLGDNLKVLFIPDKEEYFAKLNSILRVTDIFWTKPSELVFYSALGLPIVMAPSLGSQEVYNRTWLKTIRAGISQNPPRYASEWLFDWVDSGWLAEAAMSGYLDGRQFGVQNIIDVVFKGVKEPALDDSLM